MLAVVVDDFDMGVTHVIRGVDHLNNAARQMQLIEALGWPVPVYGHVPLIHGADGAKLSKRHGRSPSKPIATWAICPKRCELSAAPGLEPWRRRAHTDGKAIEWFNLEGIGRSAPFRPEEARQPQRTLHA